MKKLCALFLFFLSFLPSYSLPGNMRVIDTSNGLLSQFVLSLCQDEYGFIWAGTYNGVNMLTGSESIDLRFMQDGFNGNCIDKVVCTGKDALWVISHNSDIKKYNPLTGTLKAYPNTADVAMGYGSRNGNFVVMRNSGRHLYYYNKVKDCFSMLSGVEITPSLLRLVYFDNNNEMVVIESGRKVKGRLIAKDDGSITFQKTSTRIYPASGNIRLARFDGKSLFLITNNYDLLVSSSFNEASVYQYNLKALCDQYGEVSSFAIDDSDIIVGFTTSGAIRLHNDGGGHYEVQPIMLSYGVFDILKDPRQNVIWLATDGNGIIEITKTSYLYRSFDLGIDNGLVNKPVRALCMDSFGSLWLGTKGDGMFRINDFLKVSATGNIREATEHIASLGESSIYCIKRSQRGILWIGTGNNGLNYYSYRTKTMNSLDMGRYTNDMTTIQDVLELSKNEIWVASDEKGVFQVMLSGDGDNPTVSGIRHYYFLNKYINGTRVRCITAQGRDKIWFCCRNYGLCCYNRKTRKFTFIRLRSGNKNYNQLRMENDPLQCCVAPNGKIYCATSSGIIELTYSKGRYTWRKLFLGEDESNGIYRSVFYNRGYLWACAPTYVIGYNLSTHEVKTISNANGLKIKELNEGAAYCDPKSGVKCFGDIGSFVAISSEQADKVDDWHPELYFVYAALDNRSVRVDREKKYKLSIGPKFGSLTLYYSVPDYVNYGNYRYEYSLDNGTWTDNGNKTSLSFNSLSYGNHTLKVRYKTGQFISKSYEFPFTVKTPWYLTWWMNSFYILILLAFVIFVIHRYKQKVYYKHEQRVKDLEHKHKVDIYESKIRFFTNLTQEFTTPISLIIGPCQRILSTAGISEHIRDYALLILHNCNRLRKLFNDILQLRDIESEHRHLVVSQNDVSKIADMAYKNFKFMAEENNIEFNADIAEGVVWPLDKDAFTSALTNLLLSSFGFASNNGTINLRLFVKDDRLCISVTIFGFALSEKQKSEMFDRYRLLDRLEKGIESYNLTDNPILGLGICNGMVRSMKGTIDVKSDKDTTFFISLPRLEVTVDDETLQSQVPEVNVDAEVYDSKLPVFEEKAKDNGKSTIVILDDNKERQWLLNDIFSEKYNVAIFEDSNVALHSIIDLNPDIILSDAYTKPINGIEVCRQLKEHSITSHIPFVILSSDNSEDVRTESYKAGADVFIRQPCDVDVLRAVVDKSIEGRKQLKSYYESPVSNIVKVNSKFVKGDDKKFYDDVLRIIQENLSNPELSINFVASALSMTPRSFYRRLQAISEEKPSDLIRKARLKYASQLLVKSKMSVEEVCFQCGFSSRNTFYRLFNENFGCSPRQYREKMEKKTKEELGDTE